MEAMMPVAACSVRRLAKFIGVITFVILLASTLAGCAGDTARAGSGPAESDLEAKEDRMTDGMTDEQIEVLATYEAFEKAMVDKDVATLRKLTAEDTTFTHMSGKTQTRDEFFGEIADGTLNYYGYEIHDPVVTVDGDAAEIRASVTLDAKVYGASGSWTLPVRARLIRNGDDWLLTN